MILPGGALTQKETIEKADFTNLTWKLEGVDVSVTLIFISIYFFLFHWNIIINFDEYPDIVIFMPKRTFHEKFCENCEIWCENCGRRKL